LRTRSNRSRRRSKHEPNHYESFFGRGSCYDSLENFRKALTDYNKALSLCKDYAEIWYAKADLLYNMGRARESLLSYRMVTRLEPKNYEAWLDYGETLYELRYLKQALKSVRSFRRGESLCGGIVL